MGMSDDGKQRQREELGRRIKEAREAKGISQADLGAIAVPAPITAQSVNKWEKGGSSPNAHTLDIIAQLTGRSMKWFLYGVENSDVAGQSDEQSQVGCVIDMVNYDKISSYLGGDKRAVTGRVRTNFPCSARSFQVYAQDDSNYPEIRDGDGVVIDRDKHPRPGKLCLALFNGDPVIGRFRPKKKHIEIAPINEDWPVIEVTKHDIVGAVTEISRPHG
jgi:transcriptional regulator with XRE-family HTH domain